MDIAAFAISLHVKQSPIAFDVQAVVDFSGANPWVPVEESASLLEVVQVMDSKALHRVPVLRGGKCVSVISQSTVIEFVLSKESAVGALFSKSVSQLHAGGLGGLTRLLISVKESDTMQTAFSKILQYNIHAVAVTDNEGKLVANISVSDLQHILKWDLEYLSVSVATFFEKLGKQHPLVTCTNDTMFSEVLKRLVKEKVHRCFVVDASGRPTDLVTTTNVMEVLLFLATGERS
jgi:CBS domain-containing protein